MVKKTERTKTIDKNIDEDKAKRLEKLQGTLKTLTGKLGKDSIMILGAQPIQDIPVYSTGIFPIDIALSIGGLPQGRICEFFGPEGGGKTTVALYCIASCQKAGGTAAFMDMEHALDPKLAAKCGVKLDELAFSQPDSADQMLSMIELLVRERSVDMIVVDSVAAMASASEMEGNITDVNRVGALASLLSTTLRRLVPLASKNNVTIIFINQLRQTISTGYSQGPTETTPGGKALKFYSSVRLDVRRGKQIKHGEDVVGHELFVKVVKNKLAPPFKNAHLSLIYGKGIPEELTIVDIAIDKGILKKKGSWLAYKHETIAQGKESAAELLKKDSALAAEIKQAVLDKVKQSNFDEDTLADDVEDVTEDDVNENEPDTLPLDLSAEDIEA